MTLDDLVVVDRVLFDFVERPDKGKFVVEFLIFRYRLANDRVMFLIRRNHVAN